MRRIVALGIAVTAWACGGKLPVAADEPTTVAQASPVCACPPPVTSSSSPTVTGVAYSDEYYSERPPSMDLGYIGDAPIGREPSVPHKLQEWEKPFRLTGAYGAHRSR
jgi:hypothetical protein